MKVISWNVNGLRAAHKKGFLDWFGDEAPDILCLQETKAHEVQLPDEVKSVEGYTSFFSTPEKKGYSGVGLYAKKAPESVQYGFGDRFDSEGRTIIAEFGDFVLFNIYFPNGKRSADRLQYKMDFYDAFLEYAEKIRKSGKHVVVCGDVNTAHKEIDLARPKENVKVSGFLPKERAWMDEFLALGYKDTLRIFNQELGETTIQKWMHQRLDSTHTSYANLDITTRLNKITKLYDYGKLTKEEYQKKSEELISKM